VLLAVTAATDNEEDAEENSIDECLILRMISNLLKDFCLL